VPPEGGGLTMGSAGFYQVLQGSTGFGSTRFREVLQGSGRFWEVLQGSELHEPEPGRTPPNQVEPRRTEHAT
jgi:hypothetical protein